MVSHLGTSFAADMGYRSKTGWMPRHLGVQAPANRLLRVADTGFSPGDDFCPLWHVFDLLPDGAAGWQPKLRYA